jgi:hypothetical protein
LKSFSHERRGSAAVAMRRVNVLIDMSASRGPEI